MTTNTKIIDGVTTVEVHDQVFTDSVLTEDTLDWFSPLRLRLTLWYVGAFSLVLILFSAGVYYFIERIQCSMN